MTLTSTATPSYVWDDYDSIVNIQWKIQVRAAGREHAEEQVKAIVESLLDQVRYQNVADESIEVTIYG